MASEDRNFRYGFLEKVGFGAFEEKIELLLRENPPDFLVRLCQLSSHFVLSSVQRKQVWQLLLDVTRPDSQITEIRLQTQRLIARQIINALELMSLLDEQLGSAQKVDHSVEGHPRLLLLLFLLDSKQLQLPPNHQLEKVEMFDILCISQVFSKEFIHHNDPISVEDTYWMFKQFITSVHANYAILLETYEKFVQNLSNEDQTLHIHLVRNGIIKTSNINNSGHFYHVGSGASSSSSSSSSSSTQQQLHQSNTFSSHWIEVEQHKHQVHYKLSNYRPMVSWFVRFFAGILHQSLLVRVFDKVIGSLIHGSRPFYILISVGKALINHSRQEILQLSSCEEITRRLLMPLSKEDSEKVVIRAFSS